MFSQLLALERQAKLTLGLFKPLALYWFALPLSQCPGHWGIFLLCVCVGG